MLHAQAVTVAIFINVRKTTLSNCLPIFFRLPCPPLAKRGSLTHSQALALSKRARDVTAPPVALNRCALRLAGHQSPRLDCFSGDEPAGGRLAETIGYVGWDRIAKSLAESGGIRGLVRVVLAGMNPQGEDLLKLLAGWDRRGAIADFHVHPLHRLSGFEGLWLHSP